MQVCLADTPSGQQGAVFTPPPSIDATGGTDVTVALDNWFQTVPDHSTVMLPKTAVYACNGKGVIPGGSSGLGYTITLIDRHNLIIDGGGIPAANVFDGNGRVIGGGGCTGGAVIKATTDGTSVSAPYALNRDHFCTLGGTNITFQNLTIQGVLPNPASRTYYPNLESQYCLKVNGTVGVTVDHCNLLLPYGDCVAMQGDVRGGIATQTPCKNIVVRYSRLDGCGRMNINFLNCDTAWIHHNLLNNAGNWAYDMEIDAGAGYGANLTLEDNALGDHNHGLFPGSSGNGSHVHDVIVRRNTPVPSSAGGFSVIAGPNNPNLERWQNFTFTDNTWTTLPLSSPFWSMSNIDGVVIERNNGPAATSSIAIQLTNCTNITIPLSGPDMNNFTGTNITLLNVVTGGLPSHSASGFGRVGAGITVTVV